MSRRKIKEKNKKLSWTGLSRSLGQTGPFAPALL
jgi:hypothetical protein